MLSQQIQAHRSFTSQQEFHSNSKQLYLLDDLEILDDLDDLDDLDNLDDLGNLEILDNIETAAVHQETQNTNTK